MMDKYYVSECGREILDEESFLELDEEEQDSFTLDYSPDFMLLAEFWR